jgi:hypothetical protein
MAQRSHSAFSISTRWTPALKKLPALAIRQPYAWLVAHGIKDIENRSRRTHYRGEFLIHASLSGELLFEDTLDQIAEKTAMGLPTEFDAGGIVGVAEIVDCVRSFDSPWKARGAWGWVIANARPLPFRACKGALGFFKPRL